MVGTEIVDCHDITTTLVDKELSRQYDGGSRGTWYGEEISERNNEE